MKFHGKELLKCRAFHIAAGISSIVITSREADPSVGFLTGDIGFAGLPLSIQTVEFLIQSFLDGLACVAAPVNPVFGYFPPLRLLFSGKNSVFSDFPLDI